MSPFSNQSGLRQILLGGASAAALAVGWSAQANAAPPPLSPAWFAARSSQAASGVQGHGAGGGSAMIGGTGLSPQAVQQAQKSIANLTMAAHAVVAAQQAQASAQAAALARPSAVANGLGLGGLQPVAGATVGSPAWMGANLPTQTASASRTVVTVKQTAPTAALTWQSFNVGQNTTLNFDQSAGGSVASTWSVVNRLAITSIAPSQILGSIKAQGQVYVINRNGIIFGGGSQINVGALVASTADINQTQFQTTGIYSQLSGSTFVPSFTGAAQNSAIIVEPGALISTNTPQSSVQGGGFVLLMGGQVQNQGVISTPDGQVAMAAGHDFVLQPGFSQTSSSQVGGTSGNLQSTTLGIEVAVADGQGAVLNSGILQSTTGDITMVGHAVTQGGVVMTTTSVAQRGTIHLLTDTTDPTATVTLLPGSVTLIQPDATPATALDVSRSDSYAASAQQNVARVSQTLNDQSLLPDLQNESRIEITAGGAVSFESGSLTLAPAGQVAVATGIPGAHTGSVLVNPSATIDVSGLQAVPLPMSANEVEVNIQGFEQQDAPVNRDSMVLNNDNVFVYIPELVSLANPSGNELFTPGGLLQVTGEVGNIGHSIQEFSTVGGQVTLSSGNVITQPGSLINIAGGSIAYQSGFVQNSYVIGSNGFIYNVNTAPGNLLYTGVFNGFTETEPHWNLSQTFTGGIVNPTQTFVPGFTVGMAAGTLTVDASSASLQGTLDASVTPGPTQKGAPTGTASTSPFVAPSMLSAILAAQGSTTLTAALPATLETLAATVDPFQQPQTDAPVGGSLLIGSFNASQLVGAGPDTATVTDTLTPATLPTLPTTAASGSTATAGSGAPTSTPTAAESVQAAQISANALSASGLATLSVTASRSVHVDAPLTLSAGGQVTLTAAHVAFNASVTAPGATVVAGNFFVTGPGTATALTYTAPMAPPMAPSASISLAPNAAIDVSGLFTNALIAPQDAAGEAFVNGGNVTLQSSGPVTLGSASLINANAGGAVTASGSAIGGSGGNITLAASFPNGTDPLSLGGTLESFGTTTASGTTKPGGTLALQAPGVVIGTPDASVVRGELLLDPSFFQQGFSAYDITGYGTLTDAVGNPLQGIEVTPGTMVNPVAPTLQFTTATLNAPTGTPITQALQEALFPVYTPDPLTAKVTQRQGVSIALSSVSGTVIPQNLPSATPFVPADVVAGNDIAAAGGGSVEIGTGAAVQVDPGSQILVQGFNQVTVNGTLSAPGGSISVLNSRTQTGFNASQFVEGQSILIGPNGVLNAAAQPFVALDTRGRPFGVVPAGGTITLGGAGGASFGSSTEKFSVPAESTLGAIISTDSVVLVSPGAVVDASGTSAMIDPVAGTSGNTGGVGAAIDPTLATGPTLQASAGGTIAANSYTGIILGGGLRAASGGPGAAGGTLSLTLETPIGQGPADNPQSAIAEALRVPTEIVLSQATQPYPFPVDITPGDPTPFLNNPSLIGQANLSAQQFASGGFDNLTLFSRQLLLFNGNVALNAGQSISLTSSDIADTSTVGRVNISAPSVLLAGATGVPVPPNGTGSAVVLAGGGPGESPATGQLFPLTHLPCLTNAGGDCSGGSLTFDANLLQLQGTIRFGVSSTITLVPTDPNAPTSLAVNDPGFNTVNFVSAGDIQFLSGASGNGTDITSAGSLTFTAAQIYPTTSASAVIFAGVNPLSNSTAVTTVGGDGLIYFANGSITINGNGTDPAPPLSAGGSLSFGAANIVQNGIVRAPLGSITFGSISVPTAELGGTPAVTTVPDAALVPVTQQVTLGPNSITSVSAAGETIPFGGTSDGVTFDTIQVNSTGQFVNVGSTSAGNGPNGTITILTQSLQGDNSAVLDLSGGGTLAGEGFVPGQGGSANTLTTPLVTFNPSGAPTAPTLQTGPSSGSGAVPVYAIVPGFGSAYAQPTMPFQFGSAPTTTVSTPGTGSQITLAHAVDGLPAGTYTLLPSYYALLPGAYRIELNSSTPLLQAGTNALLNGSFQVNAVQSVANTGIQATKPIVATVTSGATLRTYSQFDEETFSQFLTAGAALTNSASPVLPQDGGTLSLGFFTVTPPVNLAAPAQTQTQTATQLATAFTFGGTALFQPAPGGVAGGVEVSAGALNNSAPLELTASSMPTPGFTGVSIQASQLNALNAGSMTIGGALTTSATTGETSPTNGPAGLISGAILRDGAELRAPQVVLIGPIVLEPGSVIDTVGAGPAPIRAGVQPVFTNASMNNTTGAGPAVLAVSNGILQFLPAQTGNAISFGVCDANPSCSPNDVARIDSEGSVVFATNGTVTVSPTVRLGAAAVTFDVANVNIGSDIALATANVPSGLPLSQSFLANLLAGDPGSGAPLLQSLTLEASQSVNFLGTVSLNTFNAQGQPALNQLVLTTPAIYGFGGANDVASLDVGTLVWAGLTTAPAASNVDAVTPIAPPPVMANGPGTGAGTLDITAQQIVLGYPADSAIQNQVPLERTILGFSNVNLTASQSVSSTNQNTLSVFQAQGAFANTTGFAHTGGTLTITTPLLTGGPGSVLSITAGNGLTVQAPAAGPGADVAAGLGGEIDLTGTLVSLNTTVSLPGGKLTATGQTGDVVLGPQALVDLAGRNTALFDQTAANPGGTVILTSVAGNVTAMPGSTVNVSAPGAAAGSVTASAAAGAVTLDGTLLGSAPAGAPSGALSVTAGSMSQDAFDALNASLNAGGFFAARSFDVKTGDLALGANPAAPLQAQAISVSLDAGNLTVDGLVNASGAKPGTISLAASGALTVNAAGVLDAQSTVLQVDSSGQPIDSLNQAQVTLTSSAGVLTLAPGSTINVSDADGVARGMVNLNVPRAGDVGISAAGPINILGAGSIALNAFQVYTPGDEGLLTGGVITQADINQIGADNTAFINAALNDADLLSRIAGLSSFGDAFHLRPGVEIDSSAASSGNLTVSGDLDLSGLRTNGLTAANTISSVVGSGEPGVLVLRAADNLNVFGSITDGFGTPPATPDDDGWTLAGGVTTSTPTIVTSAITLRGGTLGSRIGTSGTLTYNVPLEPQGTVPLTLVAGATVPVVPAGSAPVTLAASGAITSSFVATGTIMLPGGTGFTAGQMVPAGTMLPVGTVLGAGVSLPIPVNIAALTWPAGVSLSAFAGTSVFLGANLTLQPGDLIPTGSIARFISGTTIQTRTANVTNAAGDQVQGLIYAAAPMLPAGDMSWSISLVSGADLGAASTSTVQTAAALAAQASAADPTPGSLTFNDPHTGDPSNTTEKSIPVESVVRTGTGSLSLVAGGNISQDSLFGIYTAGTQSGGVTAAFNQPQPDQPGTQSVLGAVGDSISANGATYNSAVAGYQAYYPTNGGNVVVSAQGSIGGYVVGTSNGTDNIGNWLFRQGGDGTSPAYWINFGTYVTGSTNNVSLVGFTGIGALGGGNVTVSAGGNAGAMGTSLAANSSSALDIAVASTGRVQSDGSVEQTGGGSVTLTLGGALNPIYLGNGGSGLGANDPGLFGLITDTRGPVTVQAGSIGTILTSQTFAASTGVLPFDVNGAAIYGGPLLGLGDSAATLTARGDLVLSGVIDPTREIQANLREDVSIGDQANTITAPTQSWFTLWTPATSVSLLSQGGNAAPVTLYTGSGTGSDDTVADAGRLVYPPNLFVTAEQGSIFLSGQTLELAPAATGQLEMLAGQSIFGEDGQVGNNPAVVDISGANPATLPTVTNPAFSNGGTTGGDQPGLITNTPSSLVVGADPTYQDLFALAPDTPTTNLHAGDPTAALFYAVNGNIENLTTGQEIGLTNTATQASIPSIFIAAKAVRMEAGNDILSTGDTTGQTLSNETAGRNGMAFGNLILNANPTDVSVISAGQNIFEANVLVAGPGNLLVQAGGNLDQEDAGQLESIGPLVNVNALTRAGGASITAIAGVGAAGPNYTAFANLYLNPANLANTTTPLQDQPGKVVQTYQDQLLSFLQAQTGYTGGASGALAYFETLPPQVQAVFLLPIYYSELNQSGLEFTDPTSRFFKSYIRGNQAVAALLPNSGTSDTGSITMFGQSAISTDFGGNVNLLVAGGGTTLGIATAPPPGKSGLLTQGSGDINVFSQGSVELGQSRIFTTFGGAILVWAADGNIAAGEGSKTTVVSTPINEQYDNFGNISLSPTVPSAGAGIATLAPIPSVPPGDVNLVAPLGVIDAGEAGIRASGNANLAALAVVNAANIQVQGHVSGLPVVAVPNVAALTSASSAVGGAMQAALQAQNASHAQQPSTITVEVVGYGGGDSGGN